MVWFNACNLHLPSSRKLSARWLGPFQVSRRVGAVAYRLELPAYLSRLHPVFHVSLLKEYILGGDGTHVEGP